MVKVNFKTIVVTDVFFPTHKSVRCSVLMEQTDLAGEQMIETIFIPKSVMPLDGPKELIHWRNNRTGEPFLLKVDAWYAKKNKLFLHIGKK